MTIEIEQSVAYCTSDGLMREGIVTSIVKNIDNEENSLVVLWDKERKEKHIFYL